MKTLLNALLIGFAFILVPASAENIIDLTSDSSEIKEITVSSRGMAFTTDEIRVNKGDIIRLTYQNGGGSHDWVLDEFNARTNIIGRGRSETIEFTADKAGAFEFYCSVGNHRRMGMFGKFVVVD